MRRSRRGGRVHRPLLIFNSLAGWIFGYQRLKRFRPVLRPALFGAGYMSTHELGAML